jgi:Uma2 family endonuclease
MSAARRCFGSGVRRQIQAWAPNWRTHGEEHLQRFDWESLGLDVDMPGQTGHIGVMGEGAARMTYAEYLAFEESAETKHEYLDGQVVAMAGGTPEHARLCASATVLLTNALRGRRCSAFSSDLRVHVPATGRSTYPDVTVVCEKRELADVDRHAITNPILIVEC